MSGRSEVPSAGSPAGEPARERVQDATAPLVPGSGGLPGRPDGGETIKLALLTGEAESADEASPQKVTAEWALWGKDERQTGFHVLRCSKGALAADDFRHVITRYAPGVKTDLPQYTVCWIPPARGRPAYLAVGIHEHELPDADPQTPGGRLKHVDGRVVEYVRLFCVRYSDVAELGVSYSELVRAVERGHPLESGDTDPITVELPAGTEVGAVEGGAWYLAMKVAALLLTRRPVCVLGADLVRAADRLAFIDEVLSLLPFGMRATFSASTWASSTAQDLKLRLFFANARRDDDRTTYVSWGQSAAIDIHRERDQAGGMYLDWLQTAGRGAIAGLSNLTSPVRFDKAEIAGIIGGGLPADRSVADTLGDLARSLRNRDQRAVSEQTKRLGRFLAAPQQPGDRAIYRSLIAKYGLFAHHEGIHPSTKRSLYSLLLKSAYGDPLSYADYCGIEDAAAGQPGRTLRHLLLERHPAVLPYVIAATAGQGVDDRALMDVLELEAWWPQNLLHLLDREIDVIRPGHRKLLFDFGLRYLIGRSGDPRRELAAAGYLTGVLARAFPDDLREQQTRLEAVLRFVYGNQLSRGQIIEVFEQPSILLSPVVAHAVEKLSTHKDRQFIADKAVYERVSRGQGSREDAAMLVRVGRRHRDPRLSRWYSGPLIPRLGRILLAVGLSVIVVAVLVTWVILLRR